MRLGSLTFIITALFLVSACETMDDKGGGDADLGLLNVWLGEGGSGGPERGRA